MRGRALDHPGDECAALVVGAREHADSRIGHVALGKDTLEAAMRKRADEYVGQLVIGRFLRRVEMGVGGASFASIALMTAAAFSRERADAASRRVARVAPPASRGH